MSVDCMSTKCKQAILKDSYCDDDVEYVTISSFMQTRLCPSGNKVIINMGDFTRSYSVFWENHHQNSSKHVLMFWSSIPFVFCLYILSCKLL